MLARHPLRACEARGRRLRGVFTSLAIGTSRLSALHRRSGLPDLRSIMSISGKPEIDGIVASAMGPTTPARLGTSQSRRKPLPAPPNGTVSGRRPFDEPGCL